MKSMSKSLLLQPSSASPKKQQKYSAAPLHVSIPSGSEHESSSMDSIASRQSPHSSSLSQASIWVAHMSSPSPSAFTGDGVAPGAAVVGAGVVTGAAVVGAGVVTGAAVVGAGVVTGAAVVGAGVITGAAVVGAGVITGAAVVGAGVITGAAVVGAGVITGAAVVGAGVATGAAVVGAGVITGAAVVGAGVITGAGVGAGAAPAEQEHEIRVVVSARYESVRTGEGQGNTTPTTKLTCNAHAATARVTQQGSQYKENCHRQTGGMSRDASKCTTCMRSAVL